MVAVYILHSAKARKYYIGSCLIFEDRLNEHLSKKYSDSFTANYDDWVVFLLIDNLEYKESRLIERHIKRMKSKKYIENLVRYPEIVQKLCITYGNKEK